MIKILRMNNKTYKHFLTLINDGINIIGNGTNIIVDKTLNDDDIRTEYKNINNLIQ